MQAVWITLRVANVLRLLLIVLATPTTLAAARYASIVVGADDARAVDDLLLAVNEVL